MKLCLLRFNKVSMIVEGYGRVLDIDYGGWQVDPEPKVLHLGKWVHPSTGNLLVAGINLNYLGKRDLDRLRYYLPEILKNRNLYVRYHTGKKLLPDIFKNYYRTYRSDKVKLIDKETLKFMSPKEISQQGDEERAERLRKRREEFRALRAKKIPSKRIVPAKRPEIIPEIPPEEEPLPPEVPEVPEELPPEEPEIPEAPEVSKTKEKAEAAVDASRADKLMAKIDDRVKAELMEPEAPEEPEEVPAEEPEEVPEEPEETPEEETEEL